MPVSDREWNRLVTVVDRHETEISELREQKAEARGAAREGARFASRFVGVIGIIGILGQLLVVVSGWGHG